MKKIIFVLPLLAMMVVGCSNPTNTETPEEKKTVQTPVETPQEPETPVVPEEPVELETPQVPEEPVVQEDKSPYEYVKPDCVNLEDYTYVGDYIFADTMNFAEWKYSNSQTDYLLAFEKIARVKNDNPNTRIYRCNHNDPNTEIPVTKATKYKIYVKTSVVESTAENTFVLNLRTVSFEDSYDGTRLRIKKLSDGSFTINELNDPNNTLSNYVTY